MPGKTKSPSILEYKIFQWRLAGTLGGAKILTDCWNSVSSTMNYMGDMNVKGLLLSAVNIFAWSKWFLGIFLELDCVSWFLFGRLIELLQSYWDHGLKSERFTPRLFGLAWSPYETNSVSLFVLYVPAFLEIFVYKVEILAKIGCLTIAINLQNAVCNLIFLIFV